MVETPGRPQARRRECPKKEEVAVEPTTKRPRGRPPKSPTQDASAKERRSRSTSGTPAKTHGRSPSRERSASRERPRTPATSSSKAAANPMCKKHHTLESLAAKSLSMCDCCNGFINQQERCYTCGPCKFWCCRRCAAEQKLKAVLEKVNLQKLTPKPSKEQAISLPTPSKPRTHRRTSPAPKTPPKAHNLASPVLTQNRVKWKAGVLLSPKKTQEDDLEAVVLTLSGLDGYEEAVRAFIAGPGPTGYTATTLMAARSGLEAVRAQREDEVRKRRGDVELVNAQQQHRHLASEKAELADLFDNHLRSLLAGSCLHEAIFQRAMERLLAAVKAAGATETLLLTLPIALRKTPYERPPLETTAVEMMLEHLQGHAQEMDNRLAASLIRVREAEQASGEARVQDDMSTLLCRHALAEDAYAKAESVLAALHRLPAQQADAAR